MVIEKGRNEHNMTNPISLASLLIVPMLLYSTHAQDASNPLYVYSICIREKDIPPVTESNILLKTTFEMLQTYTALASVLQCVNAKTAELQKSTNPVNRFIGHTFDLYTLNTNLMAASDIYQSYQGSACLRNLVAPAQLSCLLNQTLNNGNSSADVCSAITTPCIPLPRKSDGCDERDMLLASVSSVLFYGNCLKNHAMIPGNDTIPSSTPAFEPYPVPFPETTIIFECITNFIPRNSVVLLFPPSETTSMAIDNITAAMEGHKVAVDGFCSQLQAIKGCIQSSPRKRTPLDKAIEKIVSSSFDAFDIYCLSERVITPQYRCTFRQLRNRRCNGDVFSMINFISTEINMTGGEPDYTKICDIVKSTQQCRLEHQISPCGAMYENSMRAFYGSLTFGCHSYEIFNGKMGEAIKCLKPIMEHIQANPPDPNTMVNASDAIGYWMHLYCSKRNEWMPCLRDVHKNATHQIDKMIFNVLIPDNIEIISESVCSLEDDIKKNIGCMVDVMSRQETIKSMQPCLIKAAPDFLFTLGSNISTIFEDFATTKKYTTEMCRATMPLGACLKPQIAKCDTNLADSYMSLLKKFSKGCNNPSKLSAQNSGQTKLSANIVYSVLLFTFFFFL